MLACFLKSWCVFISHAPFGPTLGALIREPILLPKGAVICSVHTQAVSALASASGARQPRPPADDTTATAPANA